MRSLSKLPFATLLGSVVIAVLLFAALVFFSGPILGFLSDRVDAKFERIKQDLEKEDIRADHKKDTTARIEKSQELPTDTPEVISDPILTGNESKESVQLDREKVKQVAADMNAIYSSARAVPYYTGNKEVVGVRLFAIQKQENLWNSIGIRNGDILKGLNGRRVSRYELFTKDLLGQLQSSGEIVVLYQRERTDRILVIQVS